MCSFRENKDEEEENRMSDFSFMNKMNDEDAYLFKRCIRKLLDSTFIVADRDEKLYEFISSESNQNDINV